VFLCFNDKAPVFLTRIIQKNLNYDLLLVSQSNSTIFQPERFFLAICSISIMNNAGLYEKYFEYSGRGRNPRSLSPAAPLVKGGGNEKNRYAAHALSAKKNRVFPL